MTICLDSSRLESGSLGMTRETAQVGTVVRDTVQRARSMYPELTLEVDMDSELPPIEMDATRISQVLDNLLSNAVKYAPSSPVSLRVVTDGDWMTIEIRDSGPGIDSEHMAHLFERFYRVPDSSRAVRGTGLGLYICRKIVEAHGGEIGVDSHPGQGTRFYFTCP